MTTRDEEEDGSRYDDGKPRFKRLWQKWAVLAEKRVMSSPNETKVNSHRLFTCKAYWRFVLPMGAEDQ